MQISPHYSCLNDLPVSGFYKNFSHAGEDYVAAGEKIFNDIKKEILSCDEKIIKERISSQHPILKNEFIDIVEKDDIYHEYNTKQHPLRLHTPLSRVLKGIIGTVKVFIGLGMAVLTAGTGVGIIGGSLMALSGVNELVCFVTGKTLGEHIQQRWPDSIKAKKVAACVDILFKVMGILGGVMGCGLANGINIIFNVNLSQTASSICGGALGFTDEMSKLIDNIFQRRELKNTSDKNAQETMQTDIYVNINDEDISVLLGAETPSNDSYLNHPNAILA